MLTLLALASTAFAAGDPLADEIRMLQSELGGPMLLCVAGEDAEQVTRRTLRDIGQEDLPITRVPTAGDVEAEMQRALEAGGLACGLRIAPTDGGFDLTRHGACTGGTRGIDPVPDATPAVGAPDANAPAAASTEAGPDGAPLVAEAEPTVPTEGEWAAREARYQRDRLMLVDLPPDPTLPTGVTWEVIDGRGASLSAHGLVAIAQDEDLVLELDRELKRSKRASKILFWTGVGLAALSPAPLIGVEGGAISANQDRAWSTVFLLASGALTVSLARAPRKAARSRQQHPALYLDGDMAEDVVVVHNHRLYGSLELDQRPPPPAEDAPQPDGDAPADAGAPADAVAPADAGAPADEGTEGDGSPEAIGPATREPAASPTEGAANPTPPAEGAPTTGGEGAASDR